MASRTFLRLLVSFASIALVAAACGDDDTEDATDDTTTTTEAPAGDEGEDSDDGDDGAAAEGDPFVVGWANSDTGTASFINITEAAEAAVEHVNANGGINGRPLELRTCDLRQTDQAAQACGQEFANDDEIMMGMVGLTQVGGPYYSALGASGKPLIGGIPATPADDTAENSFFYFPGANSLRIQQADYAQDIGATSLTYVNEDVPSANNGRERVKSLLEGTDIEFYEAILPSGASDVLPQMSSANAGESDHLQFMTSGNCPVLADALNTLGGEGEVLVINSCLTMDQLAEAPDLYDGWTMMATTKLSGAGPGIDDDIDTFLDGVEAAGLELGPFSEVGWGLVLSLARALEGADDAVFTDTEALSEVLGAFGGPVAMGPDEIECPGPDEAPTNCARSAPLYRVESGSLQPL